MNKAFIGINSKIFKSEKMARNIVVGFPRIEYIEKQPNELVERKGVGHPDSLCDGIAESVSRALSNEYVKRYGRILHHNTDQVEFLLLEHLMVINVARSSPVQTAPQESL